MQSKAPEQEFGAEFQVETLREAEAEVRSSEADSPSAPAVAKRRPVVSLPKRLRYFLKTNPAAVSAVLHILLRVVQQELLKRCPDVPENARLGAVSFIHRFGDALNEHIHYHCCVIDAVFYLQTS